MQREFLPSVSRASEAIFEQIKASTLLPRTVTDEQLASLHLLHDKTLGRALQIVDQGHVKCFVAERSQRRLFVVQGKTAADHYLVFPAHYCSCKAFLFDIVGRSEAVQCKHQLAAQLADALQTCAVIGVSNAAEEIGDMAGSAIEDIVQTAHEHSAGLMEAMTDAATSLASTASDAASGFASELGSTVASTVVAENAAAGHAIDSATAMPLIEARGAAGDVGAAGLISMGAEDGFAEPHALHHALDGPHSMWHGHGRMVSILVFVHLAAFLYWLYLYLISRKVETARKSDHARRVMKNFKCVYEFAVDRAAEFMPGRSKKPRPLSPGTSPRASIGLMPLTTIPTHQPGASANVSLKSSPSMTFMNKYFKADAP